MVFKDNVSSDEISKYIAELEAEGGSFCICKGLYINETFQEVNLRFAGMKAGLSTSAFSF